MTKLEAALRPQDIRPKFDTPQMDDASFRADPSESNRLWIAACGGRHLFTLILRGPATGRARQSGSLRPGSG
jgi:hypothetical protein